MWMLSVLRDCEMFANLRCSFEALIWSSGSPRHSIIRHHNYRSWICKQMHFMFSFILTSCAGWWDRYKWKISTFNHLIHSPYLSVCIYLSISIYLLYTFASRATNTAQVWWTTFLWTLNIQFICKRDNRPTIGRRFNVDFSDYFVYSSFVLSRDANKLIYWCSLPFI